MGYDRGDSFPFDFEPNGIPFGSKSKGKLSPRSYPIQYERKWKYNFLSAPDRWELFRLVRGYPIICFLDMNILLGKTRILMLL